MQLSSQPGPGRFCLHSFPRAHGEMSALGVASWGLDLRGSPRDRTWVSTGCCTSVLIRTLRYLSPPAGHQGSLSTVSPHQHIRSRERSAAVSGWAPSTVPLPKSRTGRLFRRRGCVLPQLSPPGLGATSAGPRNATSNQPRVHGARARGSGSQQLCSGKRAAGVAHRGIHPSPTPRRLPRAGPHLPWGRPGPGVRQTPKSQGDPGLRASTHSFRGVAKRHSTLPRRERFAEAWSAGVVPYHGHSLRRQHLLRGQCGEVGQVCQHVHQGDDGEGDDDGQGQVSARKGRWTSSKGSLAQAGPGPEPHCTGKAAGNWQAGGGVNLGQGLRRSSPGPVGETCSRSHGHHEDSTPPQRPSCPSKAGPGLALRHNQAPSPPHVRVTQVCACLYL